MKFHEIANIFPMMGEAEFDQLKADIAINGLLEPVWTYSGFILDGRNRYVACQDLGVDPRYQEYTGSDPQSFVISKNLHRRHLNETQRMLVAKKLANMNRGNYSKSANLPITPITQADAAKQLNVSERGIRMVNEVERKAPELMEKMESGEMTANEAVKEARKKERNAERKEIAESAKSIPECDKWHVEVGDIRTYQTDKKYDFIITDPPYPQEYLHLYETLAIRSKEWLKTGGLLIAMCGQSYVNQIYEMMSKHMDYYWTCAYLTIGQSASLWQKNVIPKWKPLLVYSFGKYSGKMFGDVYESGQNEKAFHKWGQSVSGMYSLISGVCLPGQSIFDPFCGAGTTGIAALKHGCLFDGIDVEVENVNISTRRIYDSTTER